MIGKRAWMTLAVVLGVALLLLAGCELLPSDPDEIEIFSDQSGSPTEAGTINAEKGTMLVFYSTIYSATRWGRFQVPFTGTYSIHHGGQPVFNVWIHSGNPYGAVMAAPANGETVTATLIAGSTYYLEAEQLGVYALGGTAVTIWGD